MGAFEDQLGKVSAKIFKEDLLNNCGASRKEVLQGPSFGVDTSVIDLGNNEALCVSSDPLSLIPSLGMKVSAWLSVYLLANDMSTTGFKPQYAQFVLNLPVDLSREQFKAYWGYIDEICLIENIAITGGHTGQIEGNTSTISGGGTMFLKAPKDQVLTSNGAKVGDCIIMTKSAGLSSTSLLSMAFPETVIEKAGLEIQKKASANFWQLSVMRESEVVAQKFETNREINAMHDVTEGGVLGAVNEMAQASGLGFEVDLDLIPIEPEVKAVAKIFQIDPLYSIGAGCMIMAVNKNVVGAVISALNNEGIQATAIGMFTKNSEQSILSDGLREIFDFAGVDPYWSAFFKAFKNGWK